VGFEALRDIAFIGREEGSGSGEPRREEAPLRHATVDCMGTRGTREDAPGLMAGLEALRVIVFDEEEGTPVGKQGGGEKPERPVDALRTSRCAAPQGGDAVSASLPRDAGLTGSLEVPTDSICSCWLLQA